MVLGLNPGLQDFVAAPVSKTPAQEVKISARFLTLPVFV
jgi:hypothetical protein